MRKRILIIFIVVCLSINLIPIFTSAKIFVHKDYSKNHSLMVGEKYDLLSINYNGTDWKSKDKKIATISKKGVIKAKKEGKTVVTFKVNGKIIECNIHVSKAHTAYTISVHGQEGAESEIKYVTKSKYNSINNGQTYESVANSIGHGSLLSYEEDENTKDITETYMWTSMDGKGTASIVFLNGKVKEKDEMFLK